MADRDPYSNPGGWGKPALAHKWHWFNGSESLCGGWFFSGTNTDRGPASEECCKACQKKLKLKEARDDAA